MEVCGGLVGDLDLDLDGDSLSWKVVGISLETSPVCLVLGYHVSRGSEIAIEK